MLSASLVPASVKSASVKSASYGFVSFSSGGFSDWTGSIFSCLDLCSLIMLQIHTRATNHRFDSVESAPFPFQHSAVVPIGPPRGNPSLMLSRIADSHISQAHDKLQPSYRYKYKRKLRTPLLFESQLKFSIVFFELQQLSQNQNTARRMEELKFIHVWNEFRRLEDDHCPESPRQLGVK